MQPTIASRGSRFWPAFKSAADLNIIRQQDAKTYAALYQQNPTDASTADWAVALAGDWMWAKPAQWPAKFDIGVVCVDASKGKSDRQGDYTAIVYMGIARGLLWIDAKIERIPLDQVVGKTIVFCDQHKPDLVGIEAEQFQELLVHEFRRQCGPDIKTRWPIYMMMTKGLKKEFRIRRLNQYITNREIRLRADSPGCRLLLEQLLELPHRRARRRPRRPGNVYPAAARGNVMNDNTPEPMTLGAISRKLQLAEDYCDYFDRLVDMSDIAEFGDGDKADRGPLPGGLPDPGSAYGRSLVYPGATAWAYINEIELRQIRARTRVFGQTNPYAIGAARNRVAYTVGSGHTYKITGRQDDVAEQITDDCLKVIEDFRKRNKWPARQKETVRRLDRDGERFLRLFADEQKGELNVRFVEPLEIQNPPDKTSAAGCYFGIQFAAVHPSGDAGQVNAVWDIETPTAYYLVNIGTLGEVIGLRETVPADQMQHLKINVNMTWPRGLPTFWALIPNMQNAVQTLKATGKIVEFRARIGMIRRHVNAAKESVQKFIADAAKAKDGPTPTASKYPFAAIIDTSDATEYQFPAGTVPVDGNVAAIQAELRTCASALAMPEYMISGDASNANFSSTMVAEAPAVKTFEEMQADLIEADIQIMERQLVIAAKAGLITDCSGDPDSDSYVLDLVKVEAEPPIIKSENRLEETQADHILFEDGLISKATYAARHGLVWTDEDEQRQTEHDADPAMQPGAGAADGRHLAAGRRDRRGPRVGLLPPCPAGIRRQTSTRPKRPGPRRAVDQSRR